MKILFHMWGGEWKLMEKEKLYTIGEVSRLCNISTKALRFYDKIGMIPPDKISESGYRYYSQDTILSIPIVKYYKQMGFRLEEMQGLVNGENYYVVEGSFHNKINELWDQENSIHNSYVSVKDWYELLQEAKEVRYSNVQEVGMRYVAVENLCYMDQDFAYRYMDSIINIPWVNYLEQINNEITGPVILEFPSWEEKMNGECKTARIMQKPIRPCEKGTNQCTFGGFMAATLYHIGPHNKIEESYQKLAAWGKTKGVKFGSNVYERYVVDYWTTRNENEFVTELIVPLKKE